MKAIIQLYWQICRMRSGPDQVPAVTSLTVLTLIGYLALSLIFRLLIDKHPLDYSLVSLFSLTLLWVALVYGVLQFKGLTSRFQQTFTAALGTEVLLTCLILPLVLLGVSVGEASPIVSVVGLAMLVIIVWAVLVQGFIFHHAFNISPLQGNLFSLMLNFLIIRLDQAMFNYFVPEALEKI